MIKHLLSVLFLCLSVVSQAQYLESFSTANKGYLMNCVNDVTGVGWSLTSWDLTGTCQNNPPDPVTDLRDPSDYFQTTAGGVLESVDLDQEVCWESPLINTTAANPVSLEMDLTWIGFDVDIAAGGCFGDYIKVLYSVNGGPYVMVPNVVGGNSCATVAYPFSGPPGPFNGSVHINHMNIAGGSTLKIRVCVSTNANAELVTIDNISVPQAGVTVGCAAPILNTAVTQAGSCNSANGSIKVTATGGTPGYNVAWSGPSNGNPGGTEIGSSGGMYTISPLTPGTYTITVTDAASCSATTTAVVITAAAMSLSTQVLLTSCSGTDDGEINLSVSNGVPPFSYSWSNLPGSPDPQDQTDLAPAAYTVTVTDNAGCTATSSATVSVSAPGAYLETFSTSDRGYLPDYIDDFAGVNWTLGAWAPQPPAAFGRDNLDFFRTSGGALVAADLDQEVCWTSPILDINPPGTGIGFSVALAWTGFDNQSDEYINVKYSVNGGGYTTVPNHVGGGAGTIQYTTGLDNNGSTTISVNGISGSTLQIQVCGNFNADMETMTIDNVSVPLSQGYACPQEINVKQAAANIADGGSYNYGNVNLGSNDSKVFTIENLGSFTLTLTGTPPNYVTKGGANPGDFTITQPLSGTIAGGSSTTFTVQFTPGGLGARSCTLSIANDDINEDPYDITLNGTGTCPPVTPTITGPTSVCSGGSILLDAGAGYIGYAWSNGGGSGQTAFFTNITSPTSYAVTVTATNGCTGTDSHMVSVNPLPTVMCPTYDPVCPDALAFALGGGSPGGGSFSGTGVNAGMFDPAVAGAGIHTMTYSYTDGNGCTNSCNFTIEVLLTCATCDDGMMNGDEQGVDCGGSCAPCSPPDAICGVITVYVDPYNPVYNGTGSNDIWWIPSDDLDGGSISEVVNPDVTVRRYLSNLTFDWTTNGACVDATPNGGSLSNADKGIVFRDCLPVRTADFNLWKLYQLRIQDPFGTDVCVGTVKVIPSAPEFSAPSVHFILPSDNDFITFNHRSDKNESFRNALMIDEVLPEVTIYPNPGTEILQLSFNARTDEQLKVYLSDITGRILSTKTYEVLRGNNLISMNMSQFAHGVYFVHLDSESIHETKRWMKSGE